MTALLSFPFVLTAQTRSNLQESYSTPNNDFTTEQNQENCEEEPCEVTPASYAQASPVVRVALNSRLRFAHFLDCSHFVHSVYEGAGFPYPYASSSDLYLGVNRFRRVSAPQSGDLVVWRGHVGIVVDPSRRSFLSVLHTGPSIDNYDSRYWKRRGRPRFFHYIKQAPGAGSSETVLSASLTRPEADEANSDSAAHPKTPGHAKNESEPSFETSTEAAAASVPTFAWEATLHSVHPSSVEIRAALSRSKARLEESLRGHDLFTSEHPVVVFDHFDVLQVHVAKDSGWVDVEIDEVMLLAEGKVQSPHGARVQRWLLKRKGRKSWELTPTTSDMYVTQQAAEQTVSRDLAQLIASNSNAPRVHQQKAELARLLNLLYAR